MKGHHAISKLLIVIETWMYQDPHVPREVVDARYASLFEGLSPSTTPRSSQGPHEVPLMQRIFLLNLWREVARV